MKWKVIIENANGEQYEVVRQYDGGECNAETCDLYTDTVCDGAEGHALPPCDEVWKVLDALSGPFGYLRFKRVKGADKGGAK